VNTVMNRVLQEVGNFFTSWAANMYLKRLYSMRF
jgi:hypothetical protein